MEGAETTLCDGRVCEIWGAGGVGFGRGDHPAQAVDSLQFIVIVEERRFSAASFEAYADPALKRPLFRKQIHYKFTNLLHFRFKQNLQVSAHPSNLIRSVNEFVGPQNNPSRAGVRSCRDPGSGFRPKRGTEQGSGRSDAIECAWRFYGVCAARASRWDIVEFACPGRCRPRNRFDPDF